MYQVVTFVNGKVLHKAVSSISEDLMVKGQGHQMKKYWQTSSFGAITLF